MTYKYLNTHFTTGEISKKAFGRTKIPTYESSLAECKNMVLDVRGGLCKRLPLYETLGSTDGFLQNGSIFGDVPDDHFDNDRFHMTNMSLSNGVNVVVIFVPDEDGINTNIYFFVDREVVVRGATVPSDDPLARRNLNAFVRQTNLYSPGDLTDLRTTQLEDTLIIVHPNKEPRLLRILSSPRQNTDENFLSNYFLDGDVEVQEISFTYDAYSNHIFDNRYLSFQINSVQSRDTDEFLKIGQILRIRVQGGSHMVEIENIPGGSEAPDTVTISPVELKPNHPDGVWVLSLNSKVGDIERWSIIFNVNSRIQDIDADWRAGDYPTSVAVADNRLWFGGTNIRPETVWASRPGSFFDFTIGPYDDDALKFTISSGRGERIQHIFGARDILIFTDKSEYSLRYDELLSPSTFTVNRNTTHGSSKIPPVQVDGEVLFVTPCRTEIRLLRYDITTQYTEAVLMTVLSESFLNDPIRSMVFAERPGYNIYCVTESGLIKVCHRRVLHDITHWSTIDTGTEVISAVVSINDDNKDDIVHVLSKRPVISSDGNERVLKYIEYFNPRPNFGVYVDCPVPVNLFDLFDTRLATVEPIFRNKEVLLYEVNETTNEVSFEGIAQVDNNNQFPLDIPPQPSFRDGRRLYIGLPIDTSVSLLHPVVFQDDGSTDGTKMAIQKVSALVYMLESLDMNGEELIKKRFPITFDSYKSQIADPYWTSEVSGDSRKYNTKTVLTTRDPFQGYILSVRRSVDVSSE